MHPPSRQPGIAGLMNESARRATEELRADLNRTQPRPRKGFLIAVYHSEFDPISAEFQGHFHVFASGDYALALERLRRLRGYRPTALVRTPVRARRKISTPAHALTYVLKSYWPQRPVLPLGANGSGKRPRHGQRIKEPYHSQVLMWLDQWTLSDLTLVMGARVGKEGLVVTHP